MKKKITLLCLVFLICLFLYQKNKKNDLKRLNIITYSSWISPFGPGHEIKKLFEKKCLCKINWINAEEAALLTQRIQLDPSRQIDLVLGLDYFQLEKTKKLKWRKVNQDFEFTPEALHFKTKYFIPYDWAPLTWIYRKSYFSKNKLNFKDMIVKRKPRSIHLQNPHTSSPGMHFLFWLWNEKLFQFSFIKELKKKVFHISPSWSNAYGLFKAHKEHMVFSYATSVFYHWKEEKDFDFDFYLSKKGHPYQVEYVGLLKKCKSCKLGEKFIHFLLSKEIQKIISYKNYMLPVIKGVHSWKEYPHFPRFPLIEISKFKKFNKRKKEILKKWKNWTE